MEKNIEFRFNQIDDDDGKLFNVLLDKMYSDLDNNKIVELELDQRLSELYDSIPFCWLVSTFRLEEIIKEKFPSYFKNKQKKRFEINVQNLNDEEIEIYIKNILNKFKRKK